MLQRLRIRWFLSLLEVLLSLWVTCRLQSLHLFRLALFLLFGVVFVWSDLR
jgi:hypothetical protein